MALPSGCPYCARRLEVVQMAVVRLQAVRSAGSLRIEIGRKPALSARLGHSIVEEADDVVPGVRVRRGETATRRAILPSHEDVGEPHAAR